MRRFSSLPVVIGLCSLISYLIVLTSPVSGTLQTPSSTSQTQIEKLDFLLGEWKGRGGRCRSDGSCGSEISQTTKVKRNKDGSSLSIDDKKKYPDLKIGVSAPAPMILNYPMSQAPAASIFYDDATQQYYWRWETPNGRKTPFVAKLIGPKSLQVKLEFTGVVALVTISVTDAGEWHERQDMWMSDKGEWIKTQETVLKKVK